jgi:hypothetical protein
LLISRIIQGGDTFGVQLKKGSVSLVNVLETVPTLRGDLMWMLTPKHLRMFSKL